MLLLSGYIYFFTGKKKPPVPVQPQGQSQQVQAPAQAQQNAPAAQQPPQVQAPQGSPTPAVPQKTPVEKDEPKPLSAKARADLLQEAKWVRNPFLLPLTGISKKKESVQATRLLAIFQKGTDRVAIIDHDVVRTGDMVGDEKVLHIGDDNVVLARGPLKRVLNLIRYEDAMQEEEPKTNATEKGK